MLLAFALLTAQVTTPEVIKTVVSTDGVIGEFYAPRSAKFRPALIVLHGSEGSILYTRGQAMALAKAGFPALAISYFGAPQQPKHLVEVPIETVDRAFAWMQKRPEVDGRKIGLLGTSRGSELALVYGTLNSRVRLVVANAAGCATYPGFIDMMTPVTKSAWTYHGKPLPVAKPKFGAGSLLDAYTKALDSADGAKAMIPIEKINGPILLLTGTKDAVWPSSMQAERIKKRAAERKFRHEVVWKNFEDAGHVLLVPPQPAGAKPLKPMTQFGGTEAGVLNAWQTAWAKMMGFLQKNLK